MGKGRAGEEFPDAPGGLGIREGDFRMEKAWPPGLAGPEESLPDAIAKLKEWTTEPVEEDPKAKKAGHKAPAAAKA